MNTVGIDVSKGKSMVAVARPFGQVVLKPFSVSHTSSELRKLEDSLKSLEGETRVILEHTGRYYEPVAHLLHAAGFFVSAVNPKLIKDYGNNSLRQVKTDKADALKNKLIAILDQTYPGGNTLFTSPVREDGHQKWVDFATTFWHVDTVRSLSLNAFTQRYYKWCKRHGYSFSSEKAAEIHATSKEQIAILPKNSLTKMLIQQAVQSLNALSKVASSIRLEMKDLAQQLPEYPVVMAMYGVGDSLGPQLMAEIGDVRRFHKRNALTAFAGVDPKVNQSGTRESKSNPATKHGSPKLRKTLFLVMETLIKKSPLDDPVFQFMDKKRAEGKPYHVYMTAGANKFLRIYYGKVREYLATLDALE